MSKIQTDILNEFFTVLSEKDEINDEMLTKLKNALLAEKGPKVDDLVNIFSASEDEIS